MIGRSNRRSLVCAFGVYLGLLLAAAPLAGQGDDLPEGPGKKLVQGVCSQCHEIEMVTIQSLTKDQWSHTVDLMVTRGAHLTPDQIPIVVAYLAANFGKAETDTSPASSPAQVSASAPSVPASISAPAPPAPATSSSATAQAAPSGPALAPAVSSRVPNAPGNQSGECRAESGCQQSKKQKGFWGFLRKKPKQPACAGKETANSDHRGL